MEGLRGRQLEELDPAHRDELERLARRITDFNNSTLRTCATCGTQTYMPNDGFGGDVCRDCCEHVTLRGYIIKVNGVACAQALCLKCGKRGDIRKNDLAPINDICFRDNVIVDESRACARCGAYGVEEQHWAPQAIFNDADEWPTSPLCRTCHRTWHAAMRAAKGVSLPPEKRIGELPRWYAA